MATGFIASILFATLVAGTPLIIVALGELVTERAGVLNLGAEGIMSVGAVAAFAAAHHSGSPALGILAGMGAGMLMSLIFGLSALTFRANQAASGLALSIFGAGLAAFLGKPYEAIVLTPVAPLRIPLLHRIPLLGPALFEHHGLVYFSWGLLGAVSWFLHRSRAGLVLRAAGESPASLHALGYDVQRIRYQAVLFGGAMAGLGGAFISVFYVPMWVEGLVAGRGWIALALVVFAGWRPHRVMLGAYLFGGCMITQMFAQGAGLPIDIPVQLLSALPYAATILVLVLISRNRDTIRLQPPASLGQPFLPDA